MTPSSGGSMAVRNAITFPLSSIGMGDSRNWPRSSANWVFCGSAGTASSKASRTSLTISPGKLLEPPPPGFPGDELLAMLGELLGDLLEELPGDLPCELPGDFDADFCAVSR